MERFSCACGEPARDTLLQAKRQLKTQDSEQHPLNPILQENCSPQNLLDMMAIAVTQIYAPANDMLLGVDLMMQLLHCCMLWDIYFNLHNVLVSTIAPALGN